MTNLDRTSATCPRTPGYKSGGPAVYGHELYCWHGWGSNRLSLVTIRLQINGKNSGGLYL